MVSKIKQSFDFKNILSFIVLGLLLCPVLYILKISWSVATIDISFLFFQISEILLQSTISATLSVGLGFFICLSYLQRGSVAQKTLHIGLLPQVLPTLMIIFSYFKVLSYFKIYPQSELHVVVLHVILNVGLVTFLLFPHLKRQMQKKAHLLVSLNLSKWKFFMFVTRDSLFPVMISLWILVFSFCMTSFSVPLLVSGEAPSSFDYLIYLKGFVDGDWSQAGLLGLVEWIFLGSLFLINRSQNQEDLRGDEIWPFKSKYSFFFIFNLLPVGAILMSVLYISIGEFRGALKTLSPEVLSIFKNTFFVSVWAVFFYTLIFWTQAYILKYSWVRRFHQFFWPVSPILLAFIGFSVVQLFYENMTFRVIGTGAAIAAFIYPVVFKFWIFPEYINLKRFYQMADVLNLPYSLSFREVVQPYLVPVYLNSLLYICLFAVGDFIIGEIIMGEVKTLGMAIRSYIQTYRLPEAQVLSLFLVVFATLVACLQFVIHSRKSCKIG